MDFETIKSRICYALGHLFSNIEVKELSIDVNHIPHWKLENFPTNNIKAVSFFLNNKQRFIMFYLTSRGETKFTRPKSGMISKLINDFNHTDFRYTLTEDFEEHGAVMGAFIDQYSNQRMSKLLEDMVKDMIEYNRVKRGIVYDIIHGYYVTETNRSTGNYAGVFELLVKKDHERSDKFKSYKGRVINGMLANEVDGEMGERCTLEDIFK
ncbi:hypothetical protein [Aeromonas phage AerS_266]|nr:hypothetical protein [Aeromonas phage AerS_266]